jgi:hypothetical protein
MAARLQELRNKITQARHAANGVCTECVSNCFVDSSASTSALQNYYRILQNLRKSLMTQ